MSAKKDPSKDLVPVFDHGQDATSYPPVVILSREACWRLKSEDLGYFICHGRAMRLCKARPIVESVIEDFLAPNGTTAPSTITWAEMKANVGIVEDWEPIGTIRRAQFKVRMYPVTGDTHAPLARTYS